MSTNENEMILDRIRGLPAISNSDPCIDPLDPNVRGVMKQPYEEEVSTPKKTANENVVGIRGYLPPLPQGEPDPAIVDMLEGFLAQAKRGQILGFAYAVLVDDGTAIPVRAINFVTKRGALAGWQLDSAVVALGRYVGRVIDDE